MTKYNLSNIMRTANGYAKTMSRSEALKKAWADAKYSNLLKMWAEAKAQGAKNGFISISKYDAEQLFYAKYPNGSIKFRRFLDTTPVQFTPNGKTYNYSGNAIDVLQKLGIAVA